MMSDIVFSNISGCPEVHEIIARWMWGFWGNQRNYEFYHSLILHSKTDEIPMVYAAFLGGNPVGAVALLRADLSRGRTFFPGWPTFSVHSDYRSRGIGSALQDFIISKAKNWVTWMYLYTPLIGYYEKGWEYMCDEMDRRRDCKDL